MRRLVLHIGKEKTGTTAIQSYLARNSLRLSRIGLVYTGYNDGNIDPTWRGLPPAHFSYAYSTIKKTIYDLSRSLALDLDSHYMTGWELTERDLRGVNKSLRGKPDNDIIVSCENFFNLWGVGLTLILKNKINDIVDPESFVGYCFSLWAHLAKSLERQLVVVVYLRRQDDHINSSYIQAIKNGALLAHNVEYYYSVYRNGNNDFDRLCTIESSLNSGDKLLVRLYDNIDRNMGVVPDFFSVLGRLSKVQEEFNDLEQRGIVNSGWGPSLVEFKLRFNRHYREDSMDNEAFYQDVFERVASVLAEVPANYYDTAFRQRILDDYRKQNRLVGERFLDKKSRKILDSLTARECRISANELTVDSAVEIAYFLTKYASGESGSDGTS